MFDLPTLTAKERKRAHDFRQYLLDEGFTMSQLSVYLRFIGSREKADAFSRRIKEKVPPMGKVSVICFTDKQFSTIQAFFNAETDSLQKKPEQLMLF